MTVVSDRLKVRLKHLSLILLSFYVSNALLDIATDYRLTVTQKFVSSLKNLLDYNVTTYRFAWVKDENNRVPLRKWKRLVLLKNMSVVTSCLDKLHSDNDRICLHEEQALRAQSAILKASSSERKGLRIATVYVFKIYPGTHFHDKHSFYALMGKLYS